GAQLTAGAFSGVAETPSRLVVIGREARGGGGDEVHLVSQQFGGRVSRGEFSRLDAGGERGWRRMARSRRRRPRRAFDKPPAFGECSPTSSVAGSSEGGCARRSETDDACLASLALDA